MSRSTSRSNEDQILDMLRHLQIEQARGRRTERHHTDRGRRSPSTATLTSDTYTLPSEEASSPARGYGRARARDRSRQDRPPSAYHSRPPPPYSRRGSSMADDSATYISIDGPLDQDRTTTVRTRTTDLDQTIVFSNNARRSGQGRDEAHVVTPSDRRPPPPPVPSVPADEVRRKVLTINSKDPAKKRKVIHMLSWFLT